MALVFKFEDAQLERLITAIKDLSDNVAKWQGEQTTATKTGFSNLVSALGGMDEETMQALINNLATTLGVSSDEVEAAIKQSTIKGD